MAAGSENLSHNTPGAKSYLPLLTHGVNWHFETGQVFRSGVLNLEDFRLFDLGIADLDADGSLDVYTSNHSARQSFLLNDGNGNFASNGLSALKLDQASEFPGLEDASDAPSVDVPGLYIYWQNSTLIFRANHTADAGGMSGEATFFPEIQVTADSGFDFTTLKHTLPNGVEQTVLKFVTLANEGQMQVTPLPIPSVGSPIAFELDQGVDLSRVFIGHQKLNPKSYEFQLQLKDRHGLVWFDYNDDGRLDVYMSRGGNRGESDIYPVELTVDEFFINGATGFEPLSTTSLGFVKEGCPARQVGAADYNWDGRLDVYIVCARGEPNQLFMQGMDGTFGSAAVDAGLAFRDDGYFAWFDADNDGDTDHFWAGTGEYRLHVNQEGSFERRLLVNTDDRAVKLTLGDFDQNGYADIYAASKATSYLFRNDQGALIPVDPGTVGLPVSALTGQWVDYDNDGLLDLFTVPGGLFRQLPDRSFEATGLLQLVVEKADLREARASWFDANGDGYRDVIVSVRVDAEDGIGAESSRIWFSEYFLNDMAGTNNWLAVQLVGRPGNRESIGAAVQVTASGNTYSQQVGWAEGGQFSQGHYRLYFGLGAEDAAVSVKVTWPNGTIQEISQVTPNQILMLTQASQP